MAGQRNAQHNLYDTKLDKPVYKQYLTSRLVSHRICLIRLTKQAFTVGPVKWRQWQRRGSNPQAVDYECNTLNAVPRDPMQLTLSSVFTREKNGGGPCSSHG